MVADATTFTISIIGVVNVMGSLLNKPHLKRFKINSLNWDVVICEKCYHVQCS